MSKIDSGHSITDDVIAFFSDVPFFERINSEEINVIAKHMALKTINKGDILFNEADEGNYICFIVSGTLEVCVQKKNSDEKTVLATLTRGQSIGEMAIIENLPRFATLVAVEDSTMYILSKSAFDLILSRHPHIGIKLLKGVSTILSNNLRQTSLKLAKFLES
jgi:CRP/FNR family cyclic AMP-dependent transcriptional regulator